MEVTNKEAANNLASNGGDNAVDKLASDVETLDVAVPKHSELHESNYEVEVERADPNSPLHSVSSFEDLKLHPNLLKGVYEMGFRKPSKIQEKALPLLLGNPPRNLIGQSQSGTGKTAAFALAMLSRIDYNSDVPQAICVAPSRELARQIMAVIKDMGKFTTVTVAEAIKQSVMRNQKVNAQLIVGTPGTMTDLIKRRLIDVKTVKIFVLDEADNMLDQQGLGDQSIRLKNMMPKKTQIVLFSATYSDEVRDFATRFAPDANQFKLKVEELSVSTIKQFYMDCKNADHKFEVLDALYALLTIGQSIIFVQRRDTADIIARRMTENGHRVINLHGGLTPTERDQVMDAFRNGDAKVLITTNVLARGIDIMQVNLVINYDIPTNVTGRTPDYETYLHRIGRTGRFGRTGVSINFVHDEMSWKLVEMIQNHFKREIVQVPTDDYNKIEKILKKEIKG